MKAVTKSLFDQTFIHEKKLRNRFIVAPMTRTSASASGVPTKEMEDYYTSFARGGFSMIITEGVYTDDHFSKTSHGQPGMVTEEQSRRWHDIGAQVHRYDSLFVCQLMHGGALSEISESTIAPSAVRPPGFKAGVGDVPCVYPVPREMTMELMNEVKEGFVRAALLASRAGFDGVEIHAANGYLLHQFITEDSNLRNDQYGGNPANRLRFLVEIFSAIRAAVSPGFMVGIRLSESKVNNLTYRWPGGASTAVELFTALRSLPVSYIHVAAEGGNWARECQYNDGSSSTGIAKSLLNVPIIANGGLHHPGTALSLIVNEEADLVSIGRAAIANPNLPQLLKSGKAPVPFFKELIKPVATLRHTKNVLQQYHALAGSVPV